MEARGMGVDNLQLLLPPADLKPDSKRARNPAVRRFHIERGIYIFNTVTLLEPQSRFGDKPLKL